jgi:hypothetical protein
LELNIFQLNGLLSYEKFFRQKRKEDFIRLSYICAKNAHCLEISFIRTRTATWSATFPDRPPKAGIAPRPQPPPTADSRIRVPTTTAGVGNRPKRRHRQLVLGLFKIVSFSFVALDYVQVVRNPECLRVNRLVEGASSDALWQASLVCVEPKISIIGNNST